MIVVTLQRNGKYWKAHWRDADGRQRGKGLGAVSSISQRTARSEVLRLENELNYEHRVTNRVPTLVGHCERFLVNRTDLAPGTVVLYQSTIGLLTSHFGEDRPIDEITRSDAADWRAALARGELAKEGTRMSPILSEATICRHVREAKTIFRAATDEDLIAYNPFDRLRSKAPDPDKDWEYIDMPTFQKLLDACRQEGWRILLALCRLAGLRQGEALRLQWSHVDLNSRRLVVENPGRYRTSKKRRREVPIVPELHALLFRAKWRVDEDNCCVIQDICTPNLWRDFRVIAKRAGLTPWARWCHTLRKNCETDWAGGFPIHVVAEWLGNSPEVAMKHYLRAEPRDYCLASGLDSRDEQGDNAAHGEQPMRVGQMRAG
jgi:integrase